LPNPDRQHGHFDAVLRRGLDARRDAGGKDCPDEAALAAYCAKSITAAQRAHLEDHFSNCARCQSTLAAMARADAIAGPPARRALARWQLYGAIAAALAGLSIAVTLMRSGRGGNEPANLYVAQGFASRALPHKRSHAPATQSDAMIALNESATPAPSMEPAAPEAPKPRGVGELNHRLGAGAIGLPPEFGGYAQREREGRAKAAGAAARQRLALMERAATVENPAAASPPPTEHPELAASAPSGAPRAIPVSPPNRIAAPALAMRLPESPGSAAPVSPGPAGAGVASAGADRLVAPLPAALPSTAASAPGTGSATITSTFRGGLAPAPVFSISTADGRERWRIGAGATIMHRDPDGSWQVQSKGLATALSAGIAPSPTVCWVVGSGGAVVRTIDGKHWQKLGSPTSSDLVAVFAADASNATVTAIDGSRYATDDGGHTWRPL
jgi:hypothetical protein